MKPIIEIKNLSKQYKIGHNQRYLSLRDSISDFFRFNNSISSSSIRVQKESVFWALNDISFDVQAGESIGIIGRNGAGKSTLLKILSRITPPTKGKIILRGRIASLLEVGTGFHPELSGRENVFMNGSILGLRRYEISQKFDEIVAFSGVERFVDTPLKHYSSGMQLRLAFAVAAHLEPEILVIDEVLAVGDAEFQKKCLGKMDEVSKSGRTVLFVSHSLDHIKRLCSRAILLNEGQIIQSGDTNTVITHYLQKNNHFFAEWRSKDHNTLATELDNPYFSIRYFAITNEFGQVIEGSLDLSTETIFIQIEGIIKEKSNILNIGFMVFGTDQTPFFMSYQTDGDEKDWVNLSTGYVRLRAPIDLTQLNEGAYRIEFLCSLHCVKFLYNDERISVKFHLEGLRANSIYYTKKRNFLLSPSIKWEILTT